MSTLTIHTDVMSDRLEADHFFDEAAGIAALDALEQHFTFAPNELEALSLAIDAGPTSIKAAEVRWGDAQNGLVLTGQGLSPVNDIEQLLEDLGNGIASGAFDNMTVVANGSELLSVSFGDDAYMLSAAGQSITLAGVLPDTLQDMFDFILTFSELFYVEESGDPAIAGIAEFMDDYAIASFTFNDGTEDLLELSASETELSVGLLGASASVDGTFPVGSLGELIAFLDAYTFAGFPDLSEVPELAITGALVTDKNGSVLIDFDGDIDSFDTTFIETVNVVGTDERDLAIYLPIYEASEAGVVNIDMGAGHDSLYFYADEVQYRGAIATTNVDMGADSGSLVLSDWTGGDYDIDLQAGTVTTHWFQGVETSPGNYENVDKSFTLNIGTDTRIELADNYDYSALGVAHVRGSAADDRIVVSHSGNELIFDGGAGTDYVELHRTNSYINDESGITFDDFTNGLLYGVGGDMFELGYSLANYNADFVALSLVDVEQFRFRLGEDDTEAVSADDVYAAVGAAVGTSGSDVLFGGETIDIIAGLGGDDTIFEDGFQARHAGAVAGQVYRLYQATLDRAPDTGGYNGWAQILDAGDQTLVEVARGFVNSNEFKAVYGELTNTEFVEQLYQNVLGRTGDEAGLSGWLDVLDNGAARESVVVGFSQSGEFQNNTAAEAAAFSMNADAASWTDEVYRIYLATLAREPDATGFDGWTNLLATGTTLDQAINGFINSPQFKATYGDLSNSQFVELLYENVLERDADTDGLQGWLDAMNNGTERAGVVRGFSQSLEFQTNTAPDLIDWMRNDMGSDAEIHGGSGTNKLVGGIMSDTFVFSADETANTTVMDFEAWDTLLFQDFSGSVADNMVEQGNNVVITLDDLTLTLLNTEITPFLVDSIVEYSDFL